MRCEDFLDERGRINWEFVKSIPEFAKLEETKQNAKWHSEGDAFLHTQYVCYAMEDILECENVDKDCSLYKQCMVAALFHDIGKAETTKWDEEKKDWKTKNHGAVGERITRRMLYDEDVILREKICYMVRHHMKLHHVMDDPIETTHKLIKLSNGMVGISIMLWLMAADMKGTGYFTEHDDAVINKINQIKKLCVGLNCLTQPFSALDRTKLVMSWNDCLDNKTVKGKPFTVYIFVGFPGCGKSTYIKNHLPNINVISRDTIRGELGINGATVDNGKKVVGAKEEEKEVSSIFDKRMIECCEKRESFVIDNTNLKYTYRQSYLKKIMQYNPYVKIIYIEAPNMLEDCIDRRSGEIPQSVYDRMYNNFDFPQLTECNELLIVKQSFDNGKIKENVYSFGKSINRNVKEILYNNFIKDLEITRGAMLLYGYDTYDTCVKYIDELVSKYKRIIEDETEIQ